MHVSNECQPAEPNDIETTLLCKKIAYRENATGLLRPKYSEKIHKNIHNYFLDPSNR